LNVLAPGIYIYDVINVRALEVKGLMKRNPVYPVILSRERISHNVSVHCWFCWECISTGILIF
jgi:hypothetical protein